MMDGMDASRARYSLGGLSDVKPESAGQPGNRTFRLVLTSGFALVRISLEKEQLYQLSRHIQSIIAVLPTSAIKQSKAAEPLWDGGPLEVDFKAGKMAIGHDATRDCLLFLAHDIEEDDEEIATVSGWIMIGQSERLAEDALKICAAGRERCFLCGQPIDTDGHMCPKSNGHGHFEG